MALARAGDGWNVLDSFIPVYVLKSFQEGVDESVRTTERSRIDGPIVFITDDQRNPKFSCPLPERRLIGTQDCCESLDANAGHRLLADQHIV